MSTVSSGYKVEQSFLVILSVVFATLSTMLILTQKKVPELVRRIHVLIHPAVLVGSVITFIWSFDPRGIHGMYPWQLMSFLKDHVSVIVFFVGSVWVCQVVTVLFELHNKNVPKNFEMILAFIPSACAEIIMIVCDICRVVTNQSYPIAALLFYFGIWCIIWGCIIIYCIRLVSSAVTGKLSETEQQQKSKILRKLHLGNIALWLIAGFEIYQAVVTFKPSLFDPNNKNGEKRDSDYLDSDYQVVQNPSIYSLSQLPLAWLVVAIVATYVCWLPIQLLFQSEEAKKTMIETVNRTTNGDILRAGGSLVGKVPQDIQYRTV
jgi:hypothetical protein